MGIVFPFSKITKFYAKEYKATFMQKNHNLSNYLINAQQNFNGVKLARVTNAHNGELVSFVS